MLTKNIVVEAMAQAIAERTGATVPATEDREQAEAAYRALVGLCGDYEAVLFYQP